MFNSKKIIATLMLTTVLTVGSAIPAFAYSASVTSTATQPASGRTSMDGSDLWTRGLKSPGNGWYMAYSYYINHSHDVYAEANLNGEKAGKTAYCGNTANANTWSYQNPYGYSVKASCTK